MVDCLEFLRGLQQAGITSFAGVPDSLLKDFCACVTDHAPPGAEIITANEGAAVAYAAGRHLATGEIGLVYLQNSGLGNTVNPLTSLTDSKVYSIPLLLLIGWRGEPGKKDEPQHLKQGEITPAQLDVLGIPWRVLPFSTAGALEAATAMIAAAKATSAPAALLVQNGTFAPCKLKNKPVHDFPLTREAALIQILETLPQNACVISTTGKTSREVFEFRAQREQGHARDFLTVGCMGHASQIALGIAHAQPSRPVFCLDGDGAALMHLGSLAICAQHGGTNFKHIVINNGAHESVGGQPTVALRLDFPALARACGYREARSVADSTALTDALRWLIAAEGPVLLEIKVRIGSRDNLGRPTTTPAQNKADFMRFLQS